MKKIMVRFQRDRTLDCIEVLVRASSEDAEVTALMDCIVGQSRDVLTVTATNGDILRIDPDDIVAASVTDKLTLLITEEAEYTVRQSLQSLESALEPRRFLRISRHELVNTDKIKKCDFTMGGTLRLELSGGMETWASRRCIPAVRARLSEKE